MTRPVIGVTCGRIPPSRPGDMTLQVQSATYVAAVLRGGGVPVLLPVVEDEKAVEASFGLLDGLLLAGGDDLDPSLYGEEPAGTVSFDRPRDRQELHYLRLAATADLPVLAVCRGMQILNVFRGGNLYQDIPTQLPDALSHQGGPDNLDHLLELRRGSPLEEILGASYVAANAYHHQAVRDLGEGLVLDAWTADGVVEGLSDPSARWIVGVQCHPESLEELEPRWDRLFTAFVDAAR